jgi:hypothetical protein
MKLRLDEIAKELIDKGFSSYDVDSPSIEQKILEILADKGFFENLSSEMELIEDEEKSEKMTYTDYLEKIGEV